MLSELILITSKQYNPIENMRLMNVTLLRRILSEKMTKMKNGEFPDGSMTLRAKIDLSSGNFNMRDPVI